MNRLRAGILRKFHFNRCRFDTNTDIDIGLCVDLDSDVDADIEDGIDIDLDVGIHVGRQCLHRKYRHRYRGLHRQRYPIQKSWRTSIVIDVDYDIVVDVAAEMGRSQLVSKSTYTGTSTSMSALIRTSVDAHVLGRR